VVIWLRTPRGPGRPPGADGEAGADIVIDLHDPCWPVIRRVAAPLADRGPWYLTETRAFFTCRAATWDAKSGDDLPADAALILAPLQRSTQDAGWQLTTYDDAPQRFLAIAARAAGMGARLAADRGIECR
jgi:hypothetical protein